MIDEARDSNSGDMGSALPCLVYSEAEVGQLLGIHRTTVRAQALLEGNPLHDCMISVTSTKRVYPRAAIHRLVGIAESTTRERVA